MKHSYILRKPELPVFLTGLIIGITLLGCEKDPNDNNNPSDTIPACWIRIAKMNSARSTHMTAVLDNKIYVAGDRGGGQSLEVYDPETDSWTMLAGMSDGREFVAGCAIHGKVYAIGGWFSEALNSIEEYDPVTDAWSIKSPMPSSRAGHNAVVLDEKIYVIGGSRGWPITEFFKTIEVYDPEMDTWETLPNSTTSEFIYRWGFGACTLNGKIYAIGGIQAKSYPSSGGFYKSLATVQEYDPENNTWVEKASMPTARFGLAAVSVNDTIYAIGGIDGFYPTEMYATVEAYDPASDTWVTKTSMPEGIVNMTACALDNKIYIAGGEDHEKTAYSTAYVYTPERDSEAK